MTEVTSILTDIATKASIGAPIIYFSYKAIKFITGLVPIIIIARSDDPKKYDRIERLGNQLIKGLFNDKFKLPSSKKKPD